MTEAPWAVSAEDLDRLGKAGLGDEAVVQAVTIAALFNYLARVADGTGVEFDYESPLPRIVVDRDREPLPRPAPDAWPAPDPARRLTLALRPATQAALAAWRGYVFDRDAPLTRRDRAVLGRAAAWSLCDAVAVAAFADAAPRSPREERLAAYSTTLTLTPWRVGEAELAVLRREGLDDRGLLDAISVIAAQNALSRIRLALAAPE